MHKKMFLIITSIIIGLILISCSQTAEEHYNKSFELAKSKDYKSAISALDMAIRLNPNYSNAYLDRGRYRFNLDLVRGIKEKYNDSVEFESRFESSINDFNKAIELDSNLIVEALIGRGHAYMLLKNYDKAVTDFEEVLRQDTTNKQITNITVHCKLLLQDTVGAKTLLDKIIKMNPNDAENYYNRAVSKLVTFKDKISACEDLNKAKQLYNPKEKYLSKNLEGEIENLLQINCSE